MHACRKKKAETGYLNFFLMYQLIYSSTENNCLCAFDFVQFRVGVARLRFWRVFTPVAVPDAAELWLGKVNGKKQRGGRDDRN